MKVELKRVALFAGLLSVLAASGMLRAQERTNLEVTMRVLGGIEEVESVKSAVKGALQRNRAGREARRARASASPERPQYSTLGNHVPIFKLDDQLEGELDDD